jgi:hypothetical protein
VNATEFCKLVENRLGWAPPAGAPYRQYRVEAAKVKRKIATDPDLYTWDNLKLAVALLAREKQPRTPMGVFAHVDRALDLALDKDHDVEHEIRQVVAYESALGDPAGWVTRFARATGQYREMALNEWKESVR